MDACLFDLLLSWIKDVISQSGSVSLLPFGEGAAGRREPSGPVPSAKKNPGNGREGLGCNP
jgi:hypothetical protein